mmetsp:Transcript_13171/g.23886  ORF Transcript_13171/g.23886 Transcript_13171/m.23886 type:complete len:747 (-) Transcript_13171:198-2438(-)|eukprot:CAMPEP_0198298298 /NCGR_PEP_ID=MMETSP1449-20131203/40465_1 /TAXON_ID=420275 /ORGANISM="Attheya septentrionalis, Strain CCMP2084" /LENGTH=746 /DNA_ID=CAMNT_0043999539 /DNA_START=262 /DNA_END=2502 /DNA_ORIENTATION=+
MDSSWANYEPQTDVMHDSMSDSDDFTTALLSETSLILQTIEKQQQQQEADVENSRESIRSIDWTASREGLNVSEVSKISHKSDHGLSDAFGSFDDPISDDMDPPPCNIDTPQKTMGYQFITPTRSPDEQTHQAYTSPSLIQESKAINPTELKRQARSIAKESIDDLDSSKLREILLARNIDIATLCDELSDLRSKMDVSEDPNANTHSQRRQQRKARALWQENSALKETDSKNLERIERLELEIKMYQVMSEKNASVNQMLNDQLKLQQDQIASFREALTNRPVTETTGNVSERIKTLRKADGTANHHRESSLDCARKVALSPKKPIIPLPEYGDERSNKLKEQVAKLQEENEMFALEVLAFEADIEEVTNAMGKNESDNVALKEKIELLDSQVSTLTQSLTEKETDAVRFRNQICRLESKLDEARTKAREGESSSMDNVPSLEGSTDLSDEEVESLKDDEASLKAKIAELKGTICILEKCGSRITPQQTQACQTESEEEGYIANNDDTKVTSRITPIVSQPPDAALKQEVESLTETIFQLQKDKEEMKTKLQNEMHENNMLRNIKTRDGYESDASTNAESLLEGLMFANQQSQEDAMAMKRLADHTIRDDLMKKDAEILKLKEQMRRSSGKTRWDAMSETISTTMSSTFDDAEENFRTMSESLSKSFEVETNRKQTSTDDKPNKATTTGESGKKEQSQKEEGTWEMLSDSLSGGLKFFSELKKTIVYDCVGAYDEPALKTNMKKQ